MDDQLMEASLRTCEDQASIDQLCVCGQIRNVIEDFCYEAFRRRDDPLGKDVEDVIMSITRFGEEKDEAAAGVRRAG
ncbi:hypothetical protein [Nonomuraea sp. NPDC003201]